MKNKTKTIAYSNIQKAIFIIFLLLSIHFWDLRLIPRLLNTENLLTWIIGGYSFLMVFQKSNLHFRNAIILFIIGLFLNVLAAYLNLDQNPKYTILSFNFYYFILLYFLLHYLELDGKFLENIIIIFGIIYSLLFAIQYLLYPFLIFNRDVSTATGEIQLEILGHGFLMLAYLLVLNRYLVNHRLINIILAIGFVLVQINSGFRTLFLGMVVVSVIMVMRMFRFKAKDFAVVTFVVLLFLGLIQFRGITEIIDGMINKTERDISLAKRFDRMIDMEFFFKKYPRNISYFLIGGGKPSRENLYRFNPEAIGQNYNIVWVDIGLLGFYIVVGGIATLGLLWYTLKAIFIKLPRDSLYLNSYFLYLLIVSITNEEIYRNGIFSVVAIGLYLIDISANEKSTADHDTTIRETFPSVKS